MIDDTDFQAFTWIKDNLGSGYQVTALDPWKSTAFKAITGKEITASVTLGPDSFSQQTYDFLLNGCTDEGFISLYHVAIIYTPYPCDNPDFVEVYPQVYALRSGDSG